MPTIDLISPIDGSVYLTRDVLSRDDVLDDWRKSRRPERAHFPSVDEERWRSRQSQRAAFVDVGVHLRHRLAARDAGLERVFREPELAHEPVERAHV